MISNRMKTEKREIRLVEEILYFLVGCLLGFAVLAIFGWWITRDMILPGVKVAHVDVGALKSSEASEKINLVIKDYELQAEFNGGRWKVPPNVYEINIESAVNNALEVGKTWNPDIFPQIIKRQIDIPLSVDINQEQYDSWAAEIADAVNIVPVPATAKAVSGKSEISNGKDGFVVDDDGLKNVISDAVANLDSTPAKVPVKPVVAELGEAQIEQVRKNADKILGDSLNIKIDQEKVELVGRELVSFLSLRPDNAGLPSKENINDYVEGLAERYNSKPQDAKFAYDGGKVKEFAAGKDGINVVIPESVDRISDSIQNLINEDGKTNDEVTLVVTKTPPEISTAQVNNLGINELIGRGESYYHHSIANRIYNVGLAASRVNGVLVPPGEEFSFNKFVGEISGATGYKSAYVISGGRTKLDDGGGVCQVSTTLFRAAMEAGLPVTERWAHAYRVGYYEQNSDPGKDATVYAPSKDFKFTNDTGHYILIQAINDPKNVHLIFEIYGTKDGRTSTISKSKVWGITPPPPDLYEEDPNLPAGTLRQVDWSAWGAKTSFEYTVTRNGETIFDKTYNSNYQPWQNVYIRGTGT